MMAMVRRLSGKGDERMNDGTTNDQFAFWKGNFSWTKWYCRNLEWEKDENETIFDIHLEPKIFEIT